MELKTGTFLEVAAFTTVIICLMIPLASAHVPKVSDGNEGLESATIIEVPTKSWAIYDEIRHGEDAIYFRLDLRSGERLFASVFTPEDNRFSPGLVVMGPDNESIGEIPPYIEVPEDYGFMVVEGERPEHAEYEPFTPSSYYFTAEADLVVNTTGTYYLAVYEPSHGGKVGVAIGYVESFTVMEWLTIPSDVIGIHLWEGQGLLLILAPLIIVLTVGSSIQVFRVKSGRTGFETQFEWLAHIAGLLFIGTGAMLLLQMALALQRAPTPVSASVTLVLALIPIFLGLYILYHTKEMIRGGDLKSRLKPMVLGLLGLLLWSGLFFGPTLMMIIALLPARNPEGREGPPPKVEEPQDGEEAE
jgi:hypothetical protein